MNCNSGSLKKLADSKVFWSLLLIALPHILLLRRQQTGFPLTLLKFTYRSYGFTNPSIMKWAKYLKKVFYITSYRSTCHCECKEDSVLTGQRTLSFISVNLTGGSGTWGDISQVTICAFRVLQYCKSLLHILDSSVSTWKSNKDCLSCSYFFFYFFFFFEKSYILLQLVN